MRCENCGLTISNAEMWKIGGDREAPTSRSMLSLCWDCKTHAEHEAETSSRLAANTIEVITPEQRDSMLRIRVA